MKLIMSLLFLFTVYSCNIENSEEEKKEILIFPNEIIKNNLFEEYKIAIWTLYLHNGLYAPIGISDSDTVFYRPLEYSFKLFSADINYDTVKLVFSLVDMQSRSVVLLNKEFFIGISILTTTKQVLSLENYYGFIVDLSIEESQNSKHDQIELERLDNTNVILNTYIDYIIAGRNYVNPWLVNEAYEKRVPKY